MNADTIRTRFLTETPSQREAVDRALELLAQTQANPALPDSNRRVERCQRLVRKAVDALVTMVLFDFARMARERPRDDREFWLPVESRALALCLVSRTPDDEADQYAEWLAETDEDGRHTLPEEMRCNACRPKPRSRRKWRGAPKTKRPTPCHLCAGTRVFRARDHYTAKVAELRERADRERVDWIDRAWANALAFNETRVGRTTARVADTAEAMS